MSDRSGNQICLDDSFSLGTDGQIESVDWNRLDGVDSWAAASRCDTCGNRIELKTVAASHMAQH